MRTFVLILCISFALSFIEAKKLSPLERKLKEEEQARKSHQAWINLYKPVKSKNPNEEEKVNSPPIVTAGAAGDSSNSGASQAPAATAKPQVVANPKEEQQKKAR